MNAGADEQTLERFQTALNSPVPPAGDPADARYLLFSQPGFLNAYRCVGRIWIDKLHAMHAEATTGGNAESTAGRRPAQELAPQGASSNPAAEANRCIQIIGQADYAAMGVRSIFKAVFRNTCPFPVDITWCVSGSDCNPGYSNLATILAGSTRGITHTGAEPQGLTAHVEFAACRNGFIPNQGTLSRQLQHACR